MQWLRHIDMLWNGSEDRNECVEDEGANCEDWDSNTDG